MLVATITTLLDDGPWRHHDGWGDGGGWWLWGSLMMAFWIALIVIAVVFVTRHSGPHPAAPSPTDRARKILAERFARGELSTDEYHERLQALD